MSEDWKVGDVAWARGYDGHPVKLKVIGLSGPETVIAERFEPVPSVGEYLPAFMDKRALTRTMEGQIPATTADLQKENALLKASIDNLEIRVRYLELRMR